MNAAVFCMVAAPIGIVAAAWYAAVAMRLCEPHGHPFDPQVACTCCGRADSLPATLHRLAGGPCRLCGSTPARWVLGAEAAGAIIPALAIYFSGEPAMAAIATLTGWLLLAIWITDEVSLWIPHVFWGTGLVAGLAAQMHAGGVTAAGWRALETVVLVAALVAASMIAKLFTSIPPVGVGDYGVVAFLAAALGYETALDVLLVAGILGLGYVAVRAARPRARRRAFTLATAAVVGTLLLGMPAAATAAVALGLWVRRSPRRARSTALPFGALLAAGTLILITWTAPLGRPSAAANPGADHLRTHRSDQP